MEQRECRVAITYVYHCGHCPNSYVDDAGHRFCNSTGRMVATMIGIPSFCPLSKQGADPITLIKDTYDKGWNDCLDNLRNIYR